MLAIDGSIDARCTLERAWELFSRFGDVAALIPSVEEVEVDGERVLARVATRLGALPVSSRVALEVVERKHLACLKAEGVSYLGETIRGQMAPGRQIAGIENGSVGKLRLHLDLRPHATEGHVSIIYHAEVEAEGRLKRIYESILKSKAPAMMEEFARNLRTSLEAVAAIEADVPAIDASAPAAIEADVPAIDASAPAAIEEKAPAGIDAGAPAAIEEKAPGAAAEREPSPREAAAPPETRALAVRSVAGAAPAQGIVARLLGWLRRLFGWIPRLAGGNR